MDSDRHMSPNYDHASIDQLKAKIDFRLKVEKTLGDISTYLVFSSAFEKALEYFLSEIADLFRIYMIDGVVICLFDEPANDEIMVLGWNSDRISNAGIDFNKFPIQNLLWLQKEIRGGLETYLPSGISNPEEAIEEQKYIEENEIQNLIAFPIFTPEYLAGMLILINVTNYHLWQEEDLRTLRMFADILGTSIFRKKTEETLSKSRDFLQSQVQRKTNDLIDEKKRIELILNTIKDGVLVLDEDGIVIIVNETAKEYFHQIFGKELFIGTNLILSEGNAFFTTARELFLSNFPQNISIEPKTGLHLQFVSAKGNYFDVSSIGTIIEFRDITPFVEFDNMRKQFVSTVSHELRTPITVINQSISNYEKYDDRLPEKTKSKLMEAISRNAILLHELIEDLLLVSRIDERRIKFHWQSYNIEKTIFEAITQLEPRAAAKDIEINLMIDIESTMIGDPNRMAQIFRIILDNGIKFSDDGGIINIKGIDSYRGKFNSEDKDGVLVQFDDNGMGISKEDLPKLFDRFFRSQKASHIPGTGLGLGIASDLIKMHKGEIFIESELNQGTSVYLFIPRLSPDQLKANK
ncbi:MAG: ATP-binding protein [Candidatus Hodarchaeales archaeon]